MRTTPASSRPQAYWFFISFLIVGLLILAAVIFLSLIYAAPAGLVLGSALFSLHLLLQASLVLSSFFTVMVVSGLIALAGVIAGIGGLRINSKLKTFQKSVGVKASETGVKTPTVATAGVHFGGAIPDAAVKASSLVADRKEFLRLIKEGTDNECQSFLKAHRGFDVNYTDENGYTPYLWSEVRKDVLNGTRTLMSMFKNARYVYVSGIRTSSFTELSTERGEILLMGVIERNDTQIFKALLNTGRMPDHLRVGELRCYLASLGRLEMLKLLFEKYKSRGFIGWLEAGAGFKKDTPLIAAARNGHVDVVRYLLAEGAKADYCNAKGENALAAARAGGYAEVIELLSGSHLSVSPRP